MSPSDVRFAVRLTPRASLDRVDGVVDGVLQARVAAPPVEGAANQALVRLIAAELGIPRGAVHLIAGASGRTKLLMVEGVAPETIEAPLARPPPLRRTARAGYHAGPRRGSGAISSVGQSARFTSVRSLVRAQYRPPSRRQQRRADSGPVSVSGTARPRRRRARSARRIRPHNPRASHVARSPRRRVDSSLAGRGLLPAPTRVRSAKPPVTAGGLAPFRRSGRGQAPQHGRQDPALAEVVHLDRPVEPGDRPEPVRSAPPRRRGRRPSTTWRGARLAPARAIVYASRPVRPSDAALSPGRNWSGSTPIPTRLERWIRS